ncbi:uncharacterized protein N7515_003967 [Penicillium bovifimosum]|uniref:Vacuolar sorting protein Vps3844 C-terminal domain-containing protein n=1 Tax=Penicillium bovifimosum TaxID=126998 RepID=A0A9W9H5Q3_9EURO|nr:uncharacterized protein N7515_003967 [Penicillium bovifimosum]KAJ5139119.1 hypothetical protein N7515_003967 [Penicillium bovifimosum]
MRWVSAFFALGLTGALQAIALDATIFTFPPRIASSITVGSQGQTITEDEARLVLELRMKSSVASVLGTVDADTVDQLNSFAPDDFILFGGAIQELAPERSILVLEGVDEQSALAMQRAQQVHLRVPQIPAAFQGSDLLRSFVESAPTTRGDDGKYCTYSNDASMATSTISQTSKECLFGDPMFADGPDLPVDDFLPLIDSVESWTAKDQRESVMKLSFKNAPSDSPLEATALETLLLHLAQASSTSKREVTVLVLPSNVESAGLSNPRVRRSAASLTPRNIPGRRSTQDSSLQSTLAPVCHASNSSCAEATNNCSGHGSCYLRYGSGVEATTGNCYACKCHQTIVQNSDGTTQTVQWGGSACQKRDISSPFFLVAGVSLLAIVMVGSAIGMLFSMGSQELPSVISAGVGAPKSQI